jgi:hypothetical protein
MAAKQFNIGQIIYIILDDNEVTLPIPAVVVEEIVNKNLDGVRKVYNISLSSDFKKKISLDKIRGEIFESVEEMEKQLIERAKQSISDMVERVKDKSLELSDAITRRKEVESFVEETE